MKVIFLDLNGVLDTYEEMNVANPSNLQRLKQIVVETGSKVVISSSLKNSYYYLGGRFCETLTNFIEEIENVGIEIIDITPKGKNREEEISMYLDLHPEIENFCIIDDDYDMEKFSGHMVKLVCQSDPSSIGLDDYHMNMAISILNRNNKKLAKEYNKN